MATFSPVQALVGRSIGKLLFARNKRLMAIGLVGTSMAISGHEATILDTDLAFLDPERTTTLLFWTTTFPFWAQIAMFRTAIHKSIFEVLKAHKIIFHSLPPTIIYL